MDNMGHWFMGVALTLCTPIFLCAQSPIPKAPQTPAGAISPPPASNTTLPDAPLAQTSTSAGKAAVCPSGASAQNKSCHPRIDPFKRFLNTSAPTPLTPLGKAELAAHNIEDPFNLVTIAGTAAFTIGLNSHTAYGPGFPGFGRDIGYSYAQDGVAEFFGTFLIPSLAHQDPHYHRMPDATIRRRILHTIAAVATAQSDSGARMTNYSSLISNPVTTELSNLYVPGIDTRPMPTFERIVIGYATEPPDNLITEFLPDVASRIHLRVIFVQRILNRISNSADASQ